MDTALPPLDLRSIERLREPELEEARVIQNVMLPAQPLRLQLEPGDSLLFFTDGLSDARNIRDQDFGIEGIEEVCRRHACESPLDLLGHLFSAIQDFNTNCKQWDDYDCRVVSLRGIIGPRALDGG
jgi:Stage II sporulation protein E (SpoIIE)